MVKSTTFDRKASNRAIVEKGEQFAQDFGVVESECKHSDGWLINIKFRHKIENAKTSFV